MSMPTAYLTSYAVRRVPPVAVLAAFTLAISSGCERMGGLRARMAANEIAHSVDIKGTPVTIGRFTAVDIENPKGNVKVIALPRNEESYIRFRVQKEQ